MTLKAHTAIKHGADDGKVVVFAPGDVVKGLSDEDLEDLKEAGVVYDDADDKVEDAPAAEAKPKAAPAK